MVIQEQSIIKTMPKNNTPPSNGASTPGGFKPPNCEYEASQLPIEIITFILWIVNLYVFFSMVIYTVKYIKRQSHIRSGDEKYVGKFNFLFLIGLFMIDVRLCLNLETLWDHENILYEVIKPIKYALSGITLALIYFILWLRQKIFYDNKFLASVSNICTKVTIWGTVTLLGIVVTVNSVFFLVLDDIPSSTYDCVYGKDFQTTMVWYKWITLMAAMGVLQTISLFLFSYPLYQQHKTAKAAIPASKNSRKSLYMRLIKHVAYSTAGCIISDLAATIIVLTFKNINHNITDFIFDLSLVSNFHLVAWAFGDYEHKVMFWKTKKKSGGAETTQPMSGTGVSRTSNNNNQ